jgi:hypothetical protein
MHPDYQSNAMTEIALALAMAFFSIMVLAMLSMGTALQAKGGAEARLAEGFQLSPATVGEAPSGNTRQVAAAEVIVYWRGRYFDAALAPIAPTALAGRDRIVLAIAPDLSISEAMAARDRIAAADLEVTALDARWMQALEEREP